MGQDTLFELTRRTIPISKNDGTFMSWCDSVINVRTDKGMHFCEFSYNLECLHKDIDIVEYSIPCSKASPAEDLCQSKFIYNEMKNYDYTEMIVDSSFWPHNKSLSQEMTNVIMSVWSPPCFINNKRLLAVLNNIGGVEIIMQKQHIWSTVINMCPYILRSLKYNSSPTTFEELKESVYIVQTCSVCWASNLNPDHSCYLVTAQKNGVLIIWKIINDDTAPEMVEKIQTDMCEIKNMLWVQKTESILLLICADVLGKVNALVIEISNKKFCLKQTHILWGHKDRMIASNLHYTVIDGNAVFFFSKHRHLVMQLLDDSCKILHQYINNINDYRITDIAVLADEYYITTINVKIYKINMSISDNTINVELNHVDFKDSYASYELHSICFSNSNTLWLFGMIDKKHFCRKGVFKIELAIMSTEAKLNSILPTFLNNPSRTLTGYWDSIDALRYRINKTKILPDVDYTKLYSDGCNDIYKLKIYLILLTLYLNMRKLGKISSDFSLPELSVDVVREKILLLQAQSTVSSIYKRHEKNNELKPLEQELLHGSLNYVKFYAKKYKTEIDIDKKIENIADSKIFSYVCQCCDDKILEDFTCGTGHLNMYCMISFTPITSEDYLVCRCCSATARTDLHLQDVLCVFCDQFLLKPD